MELAGSMAESSGGKPAFGTAIGYIERRLLFLRFSFSYFLLSWLRILNHERRK